MLLPFNSSCGANQPAGCRISHLCDVYVLATMTLVEKDCRKNEPPYKHHASHTHQNVHNLSTAFYLKCVCVFFISKRNPLGHVLWGVCVRSHEPFYFWSIRFHRMCALRVCCRCTHEDPHTLNIATSVCVCSLCQCARSRCTSGPHIIRYTLWCAASSVSFDPTKANALVLCVTHTTDTRTRALSRQSLVYNIIRTCVSVVLLHGINGMPQSRANLCAATSCTRHALYYDAHARSPLGGGQ